MFNFYVILAGRDMINDTYRSTTPRSKSRASPLQRKIQKMKVLPKTWVSPNNHLINSDQKLKLSRLALENKTKEPQNLKGTN